MRSNLLSLTANVLEKAAAELENVESTKTASIKMAHEAEASKLASQYRETFGKELEAELSTKLASDAGVRRLVSDLLDKSSAAESMGGPARNTEKTAGLRGQDAVNDAWATFGANIVRNDA